MMIYWYIGTNVYLRVYLFRVTLNMLVNTIRISMSQHSASTWWLHQKQIFSALLAFCIFCLVSFCFICAWTNSWANSGDVGDLRRHCAHYDVTVMKVYASNYAHDYIVPCCLLCSGFLCLCIRMAYLPISFDAVSMALLTQSHWSSHEIWDQCRTVTNRSKTQRLEKRWHIFDTHSTSS